MEVCVSSGESSSGGGRARDEIVIDDICERGSSGVASDIAAAASPVVNHVVGEIIHAFDFGVAGFVVDVQVSEEGDAAVGFHQAAAGMRFEALGNDAVLDGDIHCCSAD